MEHLTRVQEDAVLDPSDLELAALRAALAPLGLSVPGPITRWAMAWVSSQARALGKLRKS